MKSQPDASLDGIVTDPPWGGGPDIQGQDIWRELISGASSEAVRVVRPGGKFICWIGIAMLDPCIRSIDTRLKYVTSVAFSKIPPSFRGRLCMGPDAILIYGVGGHAKPHVRIAAGFLEYASRQKRDTKHPCARNIRAIRHLIGQWFAPGSTIADPFGGSATTACASADVGVRCSSVEIDPAMHESAMVRVSGRTANLFRMELAKR